MRKKALLLGNGKILEKRKYTVRYLNNGYKLIDKHWFIFGNESLYPITDPFLIIKLNELKEVKEKEEE